MLLPMIIEVAKIFTAYPFLWPNQESQAPVLYCFEVLVSNRRSACNRRKFFIQIKEIIIEQDIQSCCSAIEAYCLASSVL